jgi:hypothetical protein
MPCTSTSDRFSTYTPFLTSSRSCKSTFFIIVNQSLDDQTPKLKTVIFTDRNCLCGRDFLFTRSQLFWTWTSHTGVNVEIRQKSWWTYM